MSIGWVMKFTVILSLFFAFNFPVLAAESIKAPHVEISWVAPDKWGAGSAERVGLEFKIDPDWHIYWRNSGDSGAPPKFDFSGKDVVVSQPQWPIPKRIPVGHLINIGYEKSVLFLFQVSPLVASQTVDFKLNLEWLVCKEECIPGIAELTLSRPIVNTASEWSKSNKEKIDRAAKLIPFEDSSTWDLTLVEKTEEKLVVDLKVKREDLTLTPVPDLLPLDGDYVNPQAPKVEGSDGSIRYTFSLPAGRGTPMQFKFLIVQGEFAWEHDLALAAGGGLAGSVDGPAERASLVSLLFFAFIGGIILNLMPCVLPVLSIKFLSILNTSVTDRRKEALLYLAGVLTTFFALGATFLILRSAGAAIGWGFQLQSPYIILFLILLFWLMSLNFLGVFEFGESITNIAGNANSAGSFTTGILAVFVAAPCTGPFMGTALGAASILPAAPALGIFLSLGFGLGFPFVVVSFVPSLYKLMPKPGAWMERLKQFLAFPLIGTVIWLTWVFGIQLGSDGWLLSSTLLLLLALALWLVKAKSRAVKAFAVLLALATITSGFVAIPRVLKFQSNAQAPNMSVSAPYGWVAYDRAEIDKARALGRSVFVDFTAAWCITCQVNKKAVLDTKGVLKIFQDNNVLLMRADWTNQDPKITAALAEFNRNSVPVYLFYDKGAKAQILPQILTITMIENLFNKKE